MKAAAVLLGEILVQDKTAIHVEPDKTYRSTGILNRGQGLFNKGDLAGADTGYKTLSPIKTGQVIYSKLFGRGGAITTVSAAFDGSFVSSEFPHFDIDQATVNAAYLDHYLKSPSFSALLATAGSGLGQRPQRVRVDAFLSLPVPIPSRPDQDRIATHLDSLARASQSEHPASLDSILQRDWPGTRHALRELVTWAPRSEPVDKSKSYAMDGVKWYGQGLFVRETKSGDELSANSVRRILAGDLVYNRLFAGKQAFALAKEDGWASNELATFEINETLVRPRVLLAALLGPAFTAAVNYASTGSTPTGRNRLKEKDFLALEVTVPEVAQQATIERLLLAADGALELQGRSQQIAQAVLPAARNEIFNRVLAASGGHRP